MKLMLTIAGKGDDIMEKRGTKIHWIDGHLPMEERVRKIIELL